MEKLTIALVTRPSRLCSCDSCDCANIGFIYGRAENGCIWCYTYGYEAPFAEGATIYVYDMSDWFLVAHRNIPESIRPKTPFEAKITSPLYGEGQWSVEIDCDYVSLLNFDMLYESISHDEIESVLPTDSMKDIAVRYCNTLNVERFLGYSDWSLEA